MKTFVSLIRTQKWNTRSNSVSNFSDVGDPTLAEASSLAWEFSPTSNPSALLVNLR